MANENTNTKDQWKERELGGLWKCTSKSGNKMLTGKINGVSVMIIPNKFKSENERAPDYRVYKMEDQVPQGNAGTQPAAAPPKKAASKPAPPKPTQDDDVDF